MAWCGYMLYIMEYPTETDHLYLETGNETLFKTFLLIASFIPVVNTIVAIWLISNCDFGL